MNQYIWTNKQKDKNLGTINESTNESIHKNKQKYKRLTKDRVVHQLKEILSKIIFRSCTLPSIEVDVGWSFSTMAIDRKIKHDGRWWDAILLLITNWNCSGGWCSSFCCVNSWKTWVEFCWILHLVTSDFDSC